MHSPPLAEVSLRSLCACWVAFSGRIFRTITVRLKQALLEDDAADVVKDSIMDFGDRGGASDWADSTAAQSLPPLDPELLVASMRNRVEQVMRQVALVINEDPDGQWAAVTQERLAGLIGALVQEAADQALELRVTAAETTALRLRAERGQWAHKYRRMMAAEGRWPPGE